MRTRLRRLVDSRWFQLIGLFAPPVMTIAAGMFSVSLYLTLSDYVDKYDELKTRYSTLENKYSHVHSENTRWAERFEQTKEQYELDIQQWREASKEDSMRAEFWYKWQHSKNGPHCALALRLMEEYEKDAQHCGEAERAKKLGTHAFSLEWWCKERQKTIETNTNKITTKE